MKTGEKGEPDEQGLQLESKTTKEIDSLAYNIGPKGKRWKKKTLLGDYNLSGNLH